jgi:hypothetical protein
MFDDDDDERFNEYPPALHPAREALTMALSALLVIAALAWCVWRLI